jgi:hypothetical protein
MKFGLSKIAVALVCLNTSFYIESSFDDIYLEDQDSFAQVAEGLVNGWHWGVSSANACGGAQDYSDCYETYGNGGYGDYDWDWGDNYGGGDTGGSSGDGGGGSGDSGSGAASPGTIDAQEQCELDALDSKGTCVSIASGLYAVTGVGCFTLVVYSNYVVAVCEAAALWAFEDAKSDCEYTYGTSLAQCD